MKTTKVILFAPAVFGLLLLINAAEAKSKRFPYVGVWKQNDNDNKAPGHRVEFTKDGRGFFEYHEMSKTRFSYRLSGQQAAFTVKDYWPGHERTDEPHTAYMTFNVSPQNNGGRLILKMVRGYMVYARSKKKENLSPFTITLYSVWNIAASASATYPRKKSSAKANISPFLGEWKGGEGGAVLAIYYIGKEPVAQINSADYTVRLVGDTLFIFKGEDNLKYDPKEEGDPKKGGKRHLRATLIDGGNKILLRSSNDNIGKTLNKRSR